MSPAPRPHPRPSRAAQRAVAGQQDVIPRATTTTTTSGPSGDAFLLESGDYLLLESGDYMLLEA